MAEEGNGRRDMQNDARRATKEWDPWLIPCSEADNSPYPRKCRFCGWSKAFVKKRALVHFGHGGSNASDRCSKIPVVVREKFRNCGGVVPKSMSFEEMFETNDARESLNEQTMETKEGGSINPSGTNEHEALLPDSVDSTPTTIQRPRNRPPISRQRSMDEALQLGLRHNLDKMWASFFYEANIAFNVARHPAFVNAVRETAAAGFLY